MGTATTFNLAVGCTDKMLFVMLPTSVADLVKFGTAVSAEQHPRENRHFTHWSPASSSVTYALNNIESLFIYDSFMRILENLPFRRIVLYQLFILVRFALSFEIHRMPQILLPGKDKVVV